MSKLVEPIKTGFAKAMHGAKGEPEAQAEILETLLASVGMCVAASARGDAKAMNELLEGASAYLFESAASFQKLGAFMAMAQGMPRK